MGCAAAAVDARPDARRAADTLAQGLGPTHLSTHRARALAGV